MKKIFKKFGGEEKDWSKRIVRDTEFRRMFEKPRERFTKEEKLKDIEERKCEHNEEHEKTGQDCGKDCYFSLNIYNSSLCSPGFLAGSISKAHFPASFTAKWVSWLGSVQWDALCIDRNAYTLLEPQELSWTMRWEPYVENNGDTCQKESCLWWLWRPDLLM